MHDLWRYTYSERLPRLTGMHPPRSKHFIKTVGLTTTARLPGTDVTQTQNRG